MSRKRRGPHGAPAPRKVKPGKDGARPQAAGDGIAGHRGDATARRDAAAWVDAAVFAGVLGLIVITPWFRGLFFPPEQMAALLAALALFVARWWSKFSRNDHAFLRGPLDWAVFGLFLAYTASTFVAANVRTAIQEDMKYLLYFIAYWLIRELAGDERRRAMVLGAVAVTGVWVSVLGVGAAAGTFHYDSAFEGIRIFSVFQYPNTLAAYLTAAFFCALALRARATGDNGTAIRRAWPAFLWAAAAYASLFVFIFTYSRGALLVLPVVAAAFVAMQGKGRRLDSALAILLLALAAGLAGRGFEPAVAAHNAARAWSAFLLGIPLALAANLAVLLIGRLAGRRRAIALGTLAAGGLAAAGFLLTRLPADLMARIGSISLENRSAWERIEWTRNAMAIVADHPLLGAGGGGWNALYRQYQSYAYSSTEVHNHFMQVWVETGTAGFLVFLAVWLFVARSGWRAWRQAPAEGRSLVAGAGAGALALGLHSAIDFNLSLSAVSIALWSLMGTVRAAEEQAVPQQRGTTTEYRLAPRGAVYVLSALGFMGVLSLASGRVQGERAASALRSDDYQEARRLYETAVGRDPFRASYHVDLGQTYYFIGSADPASRPLVGKAKAEMEKGLRLERNNVRHHANYGTLLLRLGDWQGGLAALEKTVRLDPHKIVSYENLADVLVDVARWKVGQGDAAGARELLDRTLALKEDIAKVRSLAPPPVRKWADARDLIPEQSPTLALRWGQARAMRGELAEAEPLLHTGSRHPNPNLRSEALLWQGAVQRALGRPDEAASLVRAADAMAPGRAKELEQVEQIVKAVGQE